MHVTRPFVGGTWVRLGQITELEMEIKVKKGQWMVAFKVPFYESE